MARKLLVTLGGSGGTPNLYILDLGTQQLTRLTDGPAIDTEGAWAADGQSVYFTSDRSGGPQIYRLGHRAGRQAAAHHLRRLLQRAAASVARMARSWRW